MAYNSNDQRTVPQALQGVTSQNTGTASGAVQNSYGEVPAGNPNPEDARPGYLAVAQPGGQLAAALIPNVNGQGAGSGATLQLIGSPAGSAGGGGQYPQVAGGTAAPVPWNAPGWSNQGIYIGGVNFTESPVAPDAQDELNITPVTIPGATHGVAYSTPLAASGGSNTGITFSAPLGLPNTLAVAANGTLTATISSAPGTFTFMIEVTDSLGNHGSRWYTLTFA